MANPLAIELHAASPESTAGQGASVDIGALRSCVRLVLDIGSVSGNAPSLSVSLETSRNGVDGWRLAGGIGASNPEAVFANLQRFIRVTWNVTGTASPIVTFRIYGTAEVIYATPKDLNGFGIPAKALDSVADETKAQALLAASDEADGYLGSGFILPLTSWTSDLRKHVANMAVMTIMKVRGFQPGGSDDLIVKGQDDAVCWLTKIATHRLGPPGIVGSSPPDVEGGASLTTSDIRGF